MISIKKNEFDQILDIQLIECTPGLLLNGLGIRLTKNKYAMTEFHPTNDLQVCVKNKQCYKTFFMNDECSNKL